ncbi:sulfotransferase [Pacificoceanicola onchidii]|uniref:sulfotransferase n=1 Tax=Pacificoceanicola onchidii TaxID=2562685 RepID=UPI0010A50DF1|nr:sulfotransferase [Pacificoceanicola onchidii]
MTDEPETSISKTMIVNRRERLKALMGQETLVVCGAPRGMTSAVAFTLYNMGYFLGDILGPVNYEDMEFMDALPLPSSKTAEPETGPLPDLIARRNAAHLRWGFKLPRATFHIETLNRLLRNPVFIVCVRNPVAVEKSMSKRSNRPFEYKRFLQESKRPLDAIDAVLSGTDAPLLIIDMDQVGRDPDAFVEEFSELLGVDTDCSAIAEQLAAKGYKSSEQRDGVRFMMQSEYRDYLESLAAKPGA